MSNNIGGRLAQLRKQKGMTQTQLAVAIGKDSMAVSRWERGVRVMRADEVQVVASALGVPAGAIFEAVESVDAEPASGGEAA